MKSTIITLCLYTLFMHTPFAQECSRDLELVNSILEKANLDQIISNPDAIADDFNALKSSLGSIGLSSLKKDAPKIIFQNGKEKKSKIKNGERRIFVTSLITSDSLNLRLINPLRSEGVELIVCAHNLKGETQNLTQFIIDNTNNAEAIDLSYGNLNSCVVSITVRNALNPERIEFALLAK